VKASKILKKAGINFDEPVLLITAQEAMENLIEAIKEYCPHLNIDKMTTRDIKTFLDSYGDCIKYYHPEDYHQERAALLKNFKMLRRY